MNMRKAKRWQLETTGIDGNTLLFGVNIFEYEWTDTNRTIQVQDLPYDVPVYSAIIHGDPHEFAAAERSNCVWNFYVYKL